MHNDALQGHAGSPVATTATRIPPERERGGLIIFDYEDPTGRWLDPRTSPFSDMELHTFRSVPASQRMALATASARAASSRIRAGISTLFATSRDQVSAADKADPLGRLVSTAMMGVADTPGYTLIVAPGRWHQYLEPCGLTTDAAISQVPNTNDLWLPECDSGLRSSPPIIWRGASETETITDVKHLLAGSLTSTVITL